MSAFQNPTTSLSLHTPELEDATLSAPSKTGEAEKVARLNSASSVRWVIQSRSEFLQNYLAHGLRLTKDLSKARLFHSAGSAKSAALIFGLDRIQRVLVDANGRNVRVALTHSPSSFSFSSAYTRGCDAE